jgi:hypothetical protein
LQPTCHLMMPQYGYLEPKGQFDGEHENDRHISF